MLKLLERTHVRPESLAVLVGLAVGDGDPFARDRLGRAGLPDREHFFNIILASATFGILAIGATYVISAAGIDLSLGSVLGLPPSAVRRLSSPWSGLGTSRSSDPLARGLPLGP